MFTCTFLTVFINFCFLSILARSTSFNYPVATTIRTVDEDEYREGSNTRLEEDFKDYDEQTERNMRQGRGMMMDYDHMHMDHHEKEMDMKDEEKAVKTDPWSGYYDFIITEGSFKFWAVFQLATAVLLIYSALAAIYYAKFNPIGPDYDYYDDFFGRSDSGTPSQSPWSGLGAETFQRIFNAISSKKYS